MILGLSPLITTLPSLIQCEICSGDQRLLTNLSMAMLSGVSLLVNLRCLALALYLLCQAF